MAGTSILQNPLTLLFLVCAVGYLIGKIKLFGNYLGVSAILFVGLFFGAINPDVKIPIVLFEFGLVLFVYTIGISSSSAFFKSIRTNGFRDITFTLFTLIISVSLAIGVFFWFDLSSALVTGVYAGTSTNTPALAGVIQMVREDNGANLNEIAEALTVGYTFSYPLGIIGVMLVFKVMQRVLKVDFKEEFKALKKVYPLADELSSRSVQITNETISGKNLREIVSTYELNVLFGRINGADGEHHLTHWDTKVELGNHLMIIGSVEELDRATEILGEESEHNISYDRKHYDVRSIFVSNPALVGKEISSLNLTQNYDAIITRIRRGDVDMLAKPNVVLESGDRIRFVAKREDLKSLSRLFGDSYNTVSQLNIFSFGVGIALGLILGSIEFSLFGDVTFKLGIAGGPLVAGLVLGAIRRTGSVSWVPSYGVNTTLNQLGLIMLLAVIGINSGNAFVSNMESGAWQWALLAGTIISIGATFLSILVGFKLFKIPFSLLLGFLSNQPAILDFSQEMTQNRLPLISYSVMFPIALIMKVLFAQLLYIFLT